MSSGVQRVGIVGASSLLGKELAEVLGDALLGISDVVLLDGDDATGRVTTAADEVAVVQALAESSFDGMDFVFFTGDGEQTKAYWQAARRAGASIVDLTGTLAGEKDVLVRAPWVDASLAETGRQAVDLGTPALVSAHAAAVMLALVAVRLHGKLPVAALSATVMEPASEYGKPAMDELQQQTVGLLSFQALPKEQFDAQVAFNLLPSLGLEAKARAAGTEQRILRDYGLLSAGRLPELAVQLVHAPVFHGYTASVLVELVAPAAVNQMEAAMGGAPLDLLREGSDPPSNLSAAGQDGILVQVRAASEDDLGRRFWVWMAADNLKLAVLNAVACAMELRRLRPKGKVQ